MNEWSLHSAIKIWYSLPGDKIEVKIDDFIIDIVRNKLLIEIQTRRFSPIKKKLTSLAKNYNVRLVYPIPEQKWIIRVSKSGKIISRRKSPKKGKLTDLFYELVRFPQLIRADTFSLEILMIKENEIRCNDGKGSWRRRGVSIKDRRLIEVSDRILFENENDFLRFLPRELNETFTNRRLAKLSGVPIHLGRKITYCLSKMGAIKQVGKKGRTPLFQTIPFLD